jgi:hypothetical protein
LSSLNTFVVMSDSGLFSVSRMARGLFNVDGSLLWLLVEFRCHGMRLICCLESDLLIDVWTL